MRKINYCLFVGMLIGSIGYGRDCAPCPECMPGKYEYMNLNTDGVKLPEIDGFNDWLFLEPILSEYNQGLVLKLDVVEAYDFWRPLPKWEDMDNYARCDFMFNGFESLAQLDLDEKMADNDAELEEKMSGFGDRDINDFNRDNKRKSDKSNKSKRRRMVEETESNAGYYAAAAGAAGLGYVLTDDEKSERASQTGGNSCTNCEGVTQSGSGSGSEIASGGQSNQDGDTDNSSIPSNP